MKFGFIGAGNMASAIIKGVLRKQKAAARDIFIYDLNIVRQAEMVDSYGLSAGKSAQMIAETCDFVFLAVKPNGIAAVISEIKETVAEKRPVIISIAAGKTLTFIENAFGFQPAVIRVMPNVNALVGESMSALCKNDAVTDADFEEALALFNAIGKAVALDEAHFSNFSAIAGASPAFIYIFIDAIARAGVKAGLSKQQSLEIAAQAVLGSAKMVLESKEHPWQLADTVCSPGGTTI
ncbi:MAG: pyrroline-5-carboxylate reductase, partial [Clostridiales bacterium]|nr:pyrroline-5-carboxylate reductase [Clostridiales bacterium]